MAGQYQKLPVKVKETKLKLLKSPAQESIMNMFGYCRTPVLGLGLGVDFIPPQAT